MSEGTLVTHYLYGGNFAALGQVLHNEGYDVSAIIGDDDIDIGIMVQRMHSGEGNWLTDGREYLEEIAAQYGVEYDGWEIAMGPNNPLADLVNIKPSDDFLEVLKEIMEERERESQEQGQMS